MDNIEKDSFILLDYILSHTYEDDILVHIAQNRVRRFSYDYDRVALPTIFGYIVERVPAYLEKAGILKILTSDYFVIHRSKYVHTNTKWARLNYLVKANIQAGYKKFTKQEKLLQGYTVYKPQMMNISSIRGFNFVVIKRAKAKDWMDKIVKRVKRDKISTPQERDYYYEDKQLKFNLEGGGDDQFDFSKAEISRKLFESFWYLWKGDGKGEYTREQVVKKYKELHKEELSIGKIGEIVSNIRASIINPKPVINGRIKWKFEPRKSLWIFKISPLKC